MTQVRLTNFLQRVQAANKDFNETWSCLKPLLALMRRQVASDSFNRGALDAAIGTARADKRGAKYESALKYVEDTWGKPSLQYKGPNQANFSNVAGCLYVLIGTQVVLREVDTGAQQPYTFSTASASGNPDSVAAINITFGANVHPLRAIVFELRPTVVFEDSFPGRSQNDLGVNERVTLGFATVPAGVSAAQAGRLLWSIHGNMPPNTGLARQLKGTLHLSAADASVPLADGTAFYTAPWSTDDGWPNQPRPSRLTSVSTLRLTIQDGPSAGLYVERTFTVHTPVARMEARAPYRHVYGKPSAGFIGEIGFEPKGVSFHRIQFQEGRGTMVAKQTGFKSAPRFDRPLQQLPTPPSGYFAWEGERVHQHTSMWVNIGQGNAVDGCKLDGSDDVYSGCNTHWPNRYTVAHGPLNGKETDVPSELSWPIYWRYKTPDLAQSVLGQQVVHKATMDAAGTVTMAKAGASHTCRLDDPTVL